MDESIPASCTASRTSELRLDSIEVTTACGVPDTALQTSPSATQSQPWFVRTTACFVNSMLQNSRDVKGTNERRWTQLQQEDKRRNYKPRFRSCPQQCSSFLKKQPRQKQSKPRISPSKWPELKPPPKTPTREKDKSKTRSRWTDAIKSIEKKKRRRVTDYVEEQ